MSSHANAVQLFITPTIFLKLKNHILSNLVFHIYIYLQHWKSGKINNIKIVR